MDSRLSPLDVHHHKQTMLSQFLSDDKQHTGPPISTTNGRLGATFQCSWCRHTQSVEHLASVHIGGRRTHGRTHLCRACENTMRFALQQDTVHCLLTFSDQKDGLIPTTDGHAVGTFECTVCMDTQPCGNLGAIHLNMDMMGRTEIWCGNCRNTSRYVLDPATYALRIVRRPHPVRKMNGRFPVTFVCSWCTRVKTIPNLASVNPRREQTHMCNSCEEEGRVIWMKRLRCSVGRLLILSERHRSVTSMERVYREILTHFPPVLARTIFHMLWR